MDESQPEAKVVAIKDGKILMIAHSRDELKCY